MILFVATPKGFAPDAPVGDFVGPFKKAPYGITPIWAADNGCFKGFDQKRYERMLEKIADAVRDKRCTAPAFVTLPDKVADYAETIRLWGVWHRRLAEFGLNRAFVLQDGAERVRCPIPWEYIEAIFLGGTTEFKLGEFCRSAVKTAKFIGEWAHMGRVNSPKRLDYAKAIGCDSCDGSGMGIYRNRDLPKMLCSLRQQHLFEPCTA